MVHTDQIYTKIHSVTIERTQVFITTESIITNIRNNVSSTGTTSHQQEQRLIIMNNVSVSKDQWNAHLALEDPNLLPLTG